MSTKKTHALTLLQQGNLSVKQISEKVGLTETRIYQLRAEQKNPPVAKVKTPTVPTETDWMETQLKTAIETILENLSEGRKTDIPSVQALIALAETYYDYAHPDTRRTGTRADTDGGQDAPGTTPSGSNYVERLKRLSSGTGTDD